MTPTDLAYRKTAAQGASGLGLLISLYDTLAGDLRRAADAQRAHDLEERAKQLRHALQIVGFLENWVDAESGELARQMIAFYARARRVILNAQAKQSAEMLEELMNETLRTRQVWQGLELGGMAYGPEILPPARPAQYNHYQVPPLELHRMSWTA